MAIASGSKLKDKIKKVQDVLGDDTSDKIKFILNTRKIYQQNKKVHIFLNHL